MELNAFKSADKGETECLDEVKESNPAKKIKTEDNRQNTETQIQLICKHFCEKKRRRCKFSVMRGSEYCVEHAAYNDQVTINSI
jgi:hypothetical protein